MRRHDFRQAAARRFKLHFLPYRLVQVSWKNLSAVHENGCLIILVDGKNIKQKTENKKKLQNIYASASYRKAAA